MATTDDAFRLPPPIEPGEPGERRCIARTLEPDAARVVLGLVGGDELGVFVVLLAGLYVLLQRHGARAPLTVLSGGRALSVSPAGSVRDLLLACRDVVTRDGAAPGASNVSFSYPMTDGAAATTDLQLAARRRGDAIELLASVDGAWCSAAHAARILDHWAAILAAFADVNRALDAIDVLTAGEHEQLRAFGEPAPAPDPEHTLVELFEAQVAATPDALALADDAQRLSYRELDARASALGASLRRDAGAGPGVRIGLWGDGSADAIVGLLGIVKSGAAWVPLDPRSPPARLAALSARAQIATVVAAGEGPPAGAFDGRVVRVAAGGDDPRAPHALPRVNRPADLAYVLFTSGTTGGPKGVLVEHRAVARLLARGDFHALGPRDRVLQAATLVFDASVFEIFGALATGAALHVVSPDVRRSSLALCRVLRDRAITAAFFTTAMFNQIVDTDADALAGLDAVWFGGQESSPRHVQCAALACKPGALHHMYGPTETTVFATSYRVTRAGERDRFTPIGRPVAHTRIAVLDERMRPCPPGVVGEICIGGPGVARGYLDDTERTTHAFVADPSDPSVYRLYRSGDFGGWLADGALRFLGRRDQQMKVRGYRIELGEIEAELKRHPAVTEAVVDAPVIAGERELVAWVARRDAALDGGALAAFLGERLPPYLIPARWLFVPGFALTASGKLDRASLPDPLHAAPADDRIAPRTATERALAVIWQELLGRAPDARDRFFTVGGQSLKAAKMAALIHRRLGVELRLAEVFRDPTLAELAARIDAHAGAGFAPIPVVPDDDDAPLAPAQRALVFAAQMGEPAYHVFERLRVDGPLDTAALARAATALCRRHDALRTSFVGDGDATRQRLADTVELPVIEIDFAGRRDNELDAEARRQSGLRFDLSRAPLARLALVTLAPDRHELMITAAHVIADGSSLAILVAELWQLYRAELSGSPVLPPPRVRYRDYARWIDERLAGDALADDVAYWCRRLAAPLPRVELPADRRRAPERSFAAARHAIAFGPVRTAGLRGLARAHNTTLFAAATAALVALLHRYTGEPEVVVGAPVSTRVHDDLTGVVGVFINTVALRQRVDGDAGFAALLADVRDTVREAQAHGQAPIDRVIAALRPARDPARHPLFDVMVTLHEADALPAPPGLALARRPALYDVSRFDFTFGFLVDGEDLHLQIEHAVERFSREYVARMARHFIALVDGALADPDHPLGRLPLLPDDERARLVAFATGPPPASPETLVDRFAAHARAHPERTAVLDGDTRASYRDLDGRSAAIARALRRRGVAPGDFVGMTIDRSADTVLAIYGIWRAGAAYVPLDPAQPAVMARLIAQAGVRVVLTAADLNALDVLDIDEDLRRAAPGDAAYLLFTSGSTGEIKGVVVEHRAIANWTHDQVAALGVTPDDRVLQFFAAAFDPSIFFTGLALSSGATLCIVDRGSVEDPAQLAELLRRARPTIVGMTPSYLELVPPDALASAHTVITGGEPPDPRRLAQILDGRRHVNQYGATESTCVSAHVSAPRALATDDDLPIGRPIAGVVVHVLDRRGEPCPIGVPGELHVAGAGLARGYLGDANVAAFVADASLPGGRRYATGDLGRWRADGVLELLGRADDQIKVRGYRVEPRAVERALGELAGVERVAVLADGDGADRELVAYVQSAQPIAAAQLAAALAERLPAHCVPTRFVGVRRLPLNALGKLDRAALRAQVPDTAAEPASGDDDIERTVLALARAALHDAELGLDDNFFAAGGNSLRAIQLAARLEEALGVRVAVRELFTHASLRTLAASLRAHEPHAPVPLAAAPRAAASEDADVPDAPLAHGQRRLWLHDQLGAEPWLYNVCSFLRWDGPLDVAALGRALELLAERHEALRTIVATIDGDPRARVLDHLAPPLRVVDLRGARDPAAAARDLADAEARARVPLDAGPLLRATAATFADDRHVVILATHHFVVDGVATRVVVDELLHIYAALRAGARPQLPPLALRYRDHAALHRRLLAAADGDRLRAWWHARLAPPLPRVTLPADLFGAPDGSGQLRLVLDVALRADLERVAARAHASLFMVVFAALAAVVHVATGERDLLFGFPIDGRDRPELERVVGDYVNPIALRLHVDRRHSFAQLVDDVRRACLDAYEHRRYPFDRLVDELATPPRFELGFTWTGGAPAPLPPVPGVRLGDLEEVSLGARNHLWLYAGERADGLQLDVEYRRERYHHDTIARLVGQLERVLRAGAGEPEAILDQLFVAARPGERATRYSW